MVSKYNYYTGVIFNAYTYQAGSAIAKGGRYDNLLEKFGPQSPVPYPIFRRSQINCLLQEAPQWIVLVSFYPVKAPARQTHFYLI